MHARIKFFNKLQIFFKFVKTLKFSLIYEYRFKASDSLIQVHPETPRSLKTADWKN